MADRTTDHRGTLGRLTQAVYWFVVIDVLLVLSILPTALVWMLLARDASNIPLYTASLIFVLPATAAAFFAWRVRADDPDPVPLRAYLRGYRQNIADSLRIGVPAVLALTVLTVNIAFGEVAGTAALRGAFLVMALAVVLLSVRALSIASRFAFRFRDLCRLSVFTLLTTPLRTVSLLSLGVLMAGISVFVGDYAFLFCASLLTYAVWRSEVPVLQTVQERFVAGGSEATTAS